MEPSNRADLEVDVGQLWRMWMINPLWASLILQASLPARPAPVRVLATGTAARRWKPCASQAAFFHQNIPRPQPERGAINWRCRCETRLCQCLAGDPPANVASFVWQMLSDLHNERWIDLHPSWLRRRSLFLRGSADSESMVLTGLALYRYNTPTLTSDGQWPHNVILDTFSHI